jgi:hypothetical protein
MPPAAHSASLPLVDLPTDAADRFLALDCAGLIAPMGPIPLPNTRHLGFADLDLALLTEAAPHTVVMPLFAGPHDALTMIERLEKLGYNGRILVIAPRLPQPRLVERELRAAGTGNRLLLVSV